MQYLDTVIAALAVFVLAWGADMATGKRGLFGSALVAGTGAVCGWFIAVRVLAQYTNEQWGWVVWALGGAAVCLALYTLFQSKR